MEKITGVAVEVVPEKEKLERYGNLNDDSQDYDWGS